MNEMELQNLSRKQHLENMRDEELPKFHKDLAELQERMDILTEAFAADDEAWELSKKEFEIIKPVWKYEANPKYWEALLRIKECNYKLKRFERQNMIQPLLDNKRMLIEQIESETNEIARLEKEMN